MTKTVSTCVVVLSLLVLTSCGMNIQQANVGAPPGTGFVTKSVKVDGETRNYSVFIPHAYSTAKRWPVIVFLHGVLEAGTNGTTCLGVGLGAHIAELLRMAETENVQISAVCDVFDKRARAAAQRRGRAVYRPSHGSLHHDCGRGGKMEVTPWGKAGRAGRPSSIPFFTLTLRLRQRPAVRRAVIFARRAR